MTAQPMEILDRWINRVNARDLEAIMGFYDERAILIPTFSSRLLVAREDIRGYFAQVLQRDQLAISLHARTLRAQAIDGSATALSGIYRWQFAIDSEPFTFEARFTFLLDPARPGPILHHHSSQIPRTL